MASTRMHGEARSGRPRLSLLAAAAIAALTAVPSATLAIDENEMRRRAAEENAQPVAAEFALADEALANGLRYYRDVANCKFCHAWNGVGSRVEGEPIPASLVKSELSREQLYEVIACGRPGSGMPNHLRGSYSEEHPCYGLTAPLDRSEMPRRPFAQLTAAQIDDLVTYVQTVYQGKEMNYEYCAAYFERDAPQCQRFKTN